MKKSSLAMVLVPVSLAVCGASFYDAYRAAHPDWDGIAERGATLGETLAELHSPRRGDELITLHKLEILRIDVDPWVSLSLDDIDPKAEPIPGASYAVIANLWCRSKIDRAIYRGQHVDWYLLPENRLSAFERVLFGVGCVKGEDFRPATGTLIATERRLSSYMKERFPESQVYAIQAYTRGIVYAKVGRIEDAESVLTATDLSVDQMLKERTFKTTGRIAPNVASKSDREAVRAELVRAIADAKAGKFDRDPDDAIHSVSADPDDERERLRLDAQRRDRERAEAWERNRASRLFVEVEGGWMLVDEYKKRRGPRDAEVWVTYEEMIRIKEDRAVSAGAE